VARFRSASNTADRAAETAVDFLEQLRPPPWVVTAIVPDGATETITAQGDEARDFICANDGELQVSSDFGSGENDNR
jgi:hypothetical protein